VHRAGMTYFGAPEGDAAAGVMEEVGETVKRSGPRTSSRRKSISVSCDPHAARHVS